MFRFIAKVLLVLPILILALDVEAARPKGGSFTRYEMMTGKIKRSYWVFVPEIIKDADKMSAVIAFHGKDMTAEKFHKFIDPGLEANDYAFMMVYPQARDNHWRAGRGPGVNSHWADDETFAIELIKKIVKDHKADPQRIFSMGYSNGAQMATKLACNHADKIYAAASIVHSMNEWGCNPSHEISMIYIQGIKDPVVPYKGGGDFSYASHLESIDFFREVNNIKSGARVVKVNDTLKCRHYSNQKRSTFVIGCRLYEDGHQWPGSKGFKKDKYGPVNTSLDTNYFVLRRFYKLKAEKKKRDAAQIVSKGSINAGMTPDKLTKLVEVRKARYRKTLGLTADEAGAKLAKEKADAAARAKYAKAEAEKKAKVKKQADAKKQQVAAAKAQEQKAKRRKAQEQQAREKKAADDKRAAELLAQAEAEKRRAQDKVAARQQPASALPSPSATPAQQAAAPLAPPARVAEVPVDRSRAPTQPADVPVSPPAGAPLQQTQLARVRAPAAADSASSVPQYYRGGPSTGGLPGLGVPGPSRWTPPLEAAPESAQFSALSKVHRFNAFQSSHGISASVVAPSYPALVQNMGLALFVTPADVSIEQASSMLAAESQMLTYSMLFVHIATDADASAQRLFAVQRLLDQIEAHFGLDAPRRFAVGFSAGGDLLQGLYCDAPASFRAMATIGYAWSERDCEPMPRLPLLVMQSKTDARYPFAKSDGGRLSHGGLIAAVRAGTAQPLLETPLLLQADHRCLAWGEAGAEPVFVSCVQDWGGNTVPGARVDLGAAYGDVMTSFDGPAYLYGFFSRYDDSRFSFSRSVSPLVFR
ncbi:MAG: PHB depolymerase family esterase [Pseudomonadota bacterium]